MLSLFQYGFMVRAFEAGVLIALIAPVIGIFLVLRRYSLIADTLSHVSLAGVAIGLLVKVNPLLSAVVASVLSSLLIERLRISRRLFGESALSLFLSGSLAVAILLISLTRGFGKDLFSYLFGSITTVKQMDIWIIAVLGMLVGVTVLLLFKELVYVTIDEEAARVSGIPTKLINLVLIILSALTVALAIPIVGVLLISALLVVPVVTALQFGRGFVQTILIAEVVSLFSVIVGIIAAFYLNLSTGGTIVLIAIFCFVLSYLYNKRMK